MRDFRKLMDKDVGAIGIGAMIVFIAMVLVAGIAASVLVQTSTSLESQAMKTGSETIDEVATGLAVFDICGKVNSSDIGYLAITVKPRAGAADIDLNETVLLITDGSTKALLTYQGYTDQWMYNSTLEPGGRVFDTTNWGNCTNELFGIIVLEDADGSCGRITPVINKGDKVILTLQSVSYTHLTLPTN